MILPVIEPVHGDTVDRARHLEELDRAAAMARVRAALTQTGATTCVGCGDPLPAARQAAMPAARRCIDCQDQAERRQRASAAPRATIGGTRGWA